MQYKPNTSFPPDFLIYFIVFLCSILSGPLSAQDLIKEVLPSNSVLTGETFTYRLTYTCNNSGPCIDAQVIDLLPAEVVYVSTVPASPAGNVAAINMTPNYMGTGRTRVAFTLISPLSAGSTGVVLINVRFPNGSTPNGTTASNTAEGINLNITPGSFNTPNIIATGLYADPANEPVLSMTLPSAPANLDLPETYRVRLSNPNLPGTGNIISVGPVVVTLAPGTIFNGSTPAADCQPGCVGTTPATVTYSSPFAVPVTPGSTRDIFLNVIFPSATYLSGTNLLTSATAEIIVLGDAYKTIEPVGLTHPVTTFVPAPGASFSVNMASGTPNPPALFQNFSYEINVFNNGNVPLNNGVSIFNVPVDMQTSSVATGSYSNLGDFSAGEGVRVSYEKNTAPGVFTLWGSSPNTTINTTLTAPPPGLGAGEFITRIRWEYGQMLPEMTAISRPVINGSIINPDNAGGPTAIGDLIQACASFSAVYLAGPTHVNRNDCESFNVSGPFVQFAPSIDILSGTEHYFVGNNVNYRLNVRSAAQSSSPIPLEDMQVTFTLADGQTFNNFTFDDQGTGLPAPQQFVQDQNKIIFSWNEGSGSLGINQHVRIYLNAVINSNTSTGDAENTLHIQLKDGVIGQRCSGNSIIDTEDLDNDGNTTENICIARASIFIVTPPTAVCQNIQVQLSEDNTASVSASAINNGSHGGFGELHFSINGDTSLDFDCDDLGGQTVTLVVTDYYGGTGECTASIEILDDDNPCCAAPQAICQSFTAYLDEEGLASISVQDVDGGSTYECGLQSITLSAENFDCEDLGQNSITLNITDIRGDQSSCSAVITVADSISPVIICNNFSVSFNGEQSIPLNIGDLVEDSGDNCTIAMITLSTGQISSAQIGQLIMVTVTAVDLSGNEGSCISWVNVEGLPTGWTQNADGVNCIDGNVVSYNPGNQEFTINSTNCYYSSPFTSDELAFAQYSLCGNGSITAEVTGIWGSNAWAGITMRENNQAGAKKAQLSTNLTSNFHRREIRVTTGASAMPQQSLAQGRHWLRIVRSGNQFVGYSSSNGSQWVQSFVSNISMTSCIEMGLTLTNYSSNSISSATFANVSISTAGNLMQLPSSDVAVPTNEVPQFGIFPNPGNGDFNLSLDDFAGKSIEIQVLNLHNQIIHVRNIDQVMKSTEQINISDAAPGMYIVRIICPELKTSSRLILKN